MGQPGNTATKLQRYDDAFAAYDRAFRLDPDIPYVTGASQRKALYVGVDDIDADIADVLTRIRQGKPASVPFPLVAIPSTPADQLQLPSALFTISRTTRRSGAAKSIPTIAFASPTCRTTFTKAR